MNNSSTITAPLADQAVTDFNGDGVSDILWHNTNGDTGIWYMTASGGYSPVDLGVVDTSWLPQATGDFNADGKADILWRNSNGEVGEWISNGGTGNAGFTKVDLGNVNPAWAIEGTTDFNGDGTSDILWQNVNGDTGIWYTNATGGYTPVDIGVVDTSWSVQRVGDFNGDGKGDILWRNANGEVGLWLSNGGSGGAGFTKLDLGNVSTSWVTQGVGDFNGDHTSDILWRNVVSSDVGIWFMNPNGTYTPLDLGLVDATWTIAGVGDYNHDGKADILWRNSNGAVGEWLSTAGGGYNKVIFASADTSWSIVGTNAPISMTAAKGANPASMVHAMATMGAHGAGPVIASAASTSTSAHPMLAVPALSAA